MMLSLDPWVQDELDTLDLGHRARNNRARTMLTTMIQRPAGTIARTFADPAAREGAYRFVENPAFTWTDLAQSLHDACARRCREHEEVLLVLDGSSYRHTDTRHDDGVGPIGSRRNGARGLKIMAAIAMTTAGVPLGVAAHSIWARSETPATPHATRALDDKESRYWTVLQQRFDTALNEQAAACRVCAVADAEADALHVLVRAMNGGRFIVRMQHDRNLAAFDVLSTPRRELKTLALLEASAPRGTLAVALPRRGHRKARQVVLTAQAQSVAVRLREQWTGRRAGDVPLNVVRVLEAHAPAGEEPIEWILWTTEPIETLAQIACIVRRYALRFRIEGVFFATKTGLCETERAQLESFEALARWITMKLAVAVRTKAILDVSRSTPNLPADREFTRSEIDGALLLHQANCRGTLPLGSTPTLGQMVTLIAQLGGYTGKSSGGPPGLKTFSRGFEEVQVAARVLEFQRTGTPVPTEEDGFG